MTLSQQIAQAITIQISEGKLKPGYRLLENELTEQFNTSRAPIREALYILEKDGVVERKPRRGVFVKELSKKELTDLYETVYRLLEITLVKIMTSVSEEQLSPLFKLVEEMEETIQGKEIKKCFTLLRELQMNLFVLSNNDILKELYSNINNRLAPYRYISISYPSSLESSVEEYREILNGLREKDFEKVRANLSKKENRALSILEKVVEDTLT